MSENKENHSYVIINLKNGESVVGPAIVHRPVGNSTSVEDWIYTDFVVVDYPIKINVDYSTGKIMVGFGKYLQFTSNDNVMLTTDSIQSINYINEEVKDFYIESKKYLQNFVDKNIKEEIKEYTKTLKQRNNLTEKQYEDMVLSTFIKNVFRGGGNNDGGGSTLH